VCWRWGWIRDRPEADHANVGWTLTTLGADAVELRHRAAVGEQHSRQVGRFRQGEQATGDALAAMLVLTDLLCRQLQTPAGVVGDDAPSAIQVLRESPDRMEQCAGGVERLQGDDEGYPSDVRSLPIGQPGLRLVQGACAVAPCRPRFSPCPQPHPDPGERRALQLIAARGYAQNYYEAASGW